LLHGLLHHLCPYLLDCSLLSVASWCGLFFFGIRLLYRFEFILDTIESRLNPADTGMEIEGSLFLSGQDSA
jgi:hypothetical protein